MFSKKITKNEKTDALIFFKNTSRGSISNTQKIDLFLTEPNLSSNLKKALNRTKKEMQNRGESFAKALLIAKILNESDYIILNSSKNLVDGFDALLKDNSNSNKMNKIIIRTIISSTIATLIVYFSYYSLYEWVHSLKSMLEMSINEKIPGTFTYENKTFYIILFYGNFTLLGLAYSFFSITKRYYPKFHNTTFSFSRNDATKNIVQSIYNLFIAGISFPIIFEQMSIISKGVTEKIFFKDINNSIKNKGQKNFKKIGYEKLGLDARIMNLLQIGDHSKSESGMIDSLIASKENIDERIGKNLEGHQKFAPFIGDFVGFIIIMIPIVDINVWIGFTIPMKMMNI